MNERSPLTRLAPPLALAGGLTMAFCQWLIFVYAPVEASLGLPQKIFYLHLPLAWWGLFSFFLVFLASGLYLWKGSPFWDDLAGAGAEVGLLLAVLALVSGSIWAKSSWGLWWTWDPRLTTTLVMCFVYAAYLIIRHMDMPPRRRARLAAVLGVIAFLDVPLVFFSARLWSYIHPRSISLEAEMKLTLMACIAGFGLIWAALTTLALQLATDKRRLEQLAEQSLLRGE